MELKEAEDFLNYFIENSGTSTVDKAKLEKLMSNSCKAAVKANDRLDLLEIQALIKDLSNCVNPYSCPHGRPTFIKMTRYEIEKLFKRV